LSGERSSRSDLLEGPIGPVLRRLSLPMVMGAGAIILFHVIVTWRPARNDPIELRRAGVFDQGTRSGA